MIEDGNPLESETRDRSVLRHAESLGAVEFAESFQASFRTLWLIAVGIVGEPALAEDVVQEAAIAALAKLDQFTPGTNFRAWMGRIVHFVAMNQARKEKRRRSAGSDPDGRPDARSYPQRRRTRIRLAQGGAVGSSDGPRDRPVDRR